MVVTFYFSLKYKFEKGNGWWNSIKNQWWPNVIEGEVASIGQLPLMSITTLISKTKFILLLPFCWQVFTDISKGLFRSVCVHAQSLQLCPTLCDPTDVARQDPLSMGFSRQEYWSGVPCPPPRDTTWGSNPHLLSLLHCRWIFYPLSQTGKPPLFMQIKL